MPVTIQQTAKRWKAFQIIGWMLIVVGAALAIWSVSQQPTWDHLQRDPTFLFGVAFVVLGGLSDSYGRFMSWWHHG